jgi:hypothetical protein
MALISKEALENQNAAWRPTKRIFACGDQGSATPKTDDDSGAHGALLLVSFPDHQATLLVDQLNRFASASGGNVFLGEIAQDPHNGDYRTVSVDITKQDWHRLQSKLAQAGWQRFGHEGDLIHALPGGGFLVARPKF